MSTAQTLQSDFRVEHDWLVVVTTAQPSGPGTGAVLAEADRLLQQHGVRGVLFDTRGVLPPTEDARRLWWAWAEAGVHHDAVALLVESELTRISGNMTAMSRGAKVRSFHVWADAEAWLRAVAAAQSG